MRVKSKAVVLSKALNRTSFRDENNEVMDKIVDMILNGYNRESVLDRISDLTEFPFELYDFAKSRVTVRRKFSKWNRLWLDSYSCSYSTPEYVGKYRGERLRKSKMYDLGSGAGMQSIMFAGFSDVVAVERNTTRNLMANLNALEYAAKVDFRDSDAFKFIETGEIGTDATVFSDPLRVRDEAGSVTLLPDPDIMKKKLQHVTGRFVFDLPPLTPVETISIESEAEFISLNGSLVRLTEYSSKLAESQSTAVIFPSKRIVRGERKKHEFLSGDGPRYVCVPDVALVSAELTHLVEDYGEFFLGNRDRRRLILGSKREPDSEFPGDMFSVIGFGTIGQIRDMIKRERPSKLYLRYSVNPGEYYKIANQLNPVPGYGEPLYIFHLQNGYTLCSKMT